MVYETKYDGNLSEVSEDDMTQEYERINPDYHLNRVIERLTEVLGNPDLRAGHLQFQILVEWLERHVDALGTLPDDYDDTIKKFEERDDFKKLSLEAQGAQLAIKKGGILLALIYKRRPLRERLKA